MVHIKKIIFKNNKNNMGKKNPRAWGVDLWKPFIIFMTWLEMVLHDASGEQWIPAEPECGLSKLGQ